MKTLLWVVGTLLAVAFVYLTLFCSNPAARRPIDAIENELAEAISIGDSLHDVQESPKRRYRRESEVRTQKEQEEEKTVLVFSFGSYHTLETFPHLHSVNAICYFDANKNLTHFQVARQIDGP